MPRSNTPAAPAGTELITLDQVQDVLLNGADVDVVSEEEVQRDMVRRVLEAEDLAGAFGSFRATATKEVEGQLLQIRGIAWLKSGFEAGPKVYALIDAALVDTGESVTLSMGGRTLMASFLWAQRHAAMPFKGSFVSQQSRANPEFRFWTFELA